MNKVSVRRANDPVPTGQRDSEAKLLSPFEAPSHFTLYPKDVKYRVGLLKNEP